MQNNNAFQEVDNNSLIRMINQKKKPKDSTVDSVAKRARALMRFREELKDRQAKEEERKRKKGSYIAGLDPIEDDTVSMDSEQKGHFQEIQDMSIEIYEHKLGIGANYLQGQMGGRDQKKDFQDRMIQLSMMKSNKLRRTITQALKDSEHKVDEEEEELRNMSDKQKQIRQQLKLKQEKYYTSYIQDLKKSRLSRNTLVETLMVNQLHHNKTQRQLALLCA